MLDGHISIGRLTVFGRNAMHWGVTFWTKRWGYICFRLPFFCFGRWWPLYFYISPNATPWASTFFLGNNHHKCDNNKKRAPLRKQAFGHNFSTEKNSEELTRINDMVIK